MSKSNRRPPKVKPPAGSTPPNPRALIVLLVIALALALARTVTINGGIHVNL